MQAIMADLVPLLGPLQLMCRPEVRFAPSKVAALRPVSEHRTSFAPENNAGRSTELTHSAAHNVGLQDRARGLTGEINGLSDAG